MMVHMLLMSPSRIQRKLCGHRKSPSTLAHMDGQSVSRRLGRQCVGAGLASVRGSLPSLQDLMMNFGVSPSNSQEQGGESHPGVLRGNDCRIPSHQRIPHFLLGVARLETVE